jgi:hypothetical protein
MNKTKCVIFVLVLSFLLVEVSHTQKTDFYGYGAGRYSSEDRSTPLSLLWARVGVKAKYTKNNVFRGELIGHFEYGLTDNEATRAHARYSFPLVNGTASLLAGLYLSPVSFLHPSPKWIRVPHRLPTGKGAQVTPIGISAWYEWKEGIVRSSIQSRDGSLIGSLSTTYKSLSILGSDVGYGAMYKQRINERWLNIWLGGINFTGNRVPFDKGVFIKYFLEPANNVRIYSQFDMYTKPKKVG